MALSSKRPSKEHPDNQTKLMDLQTGEPAMARVNFNLTEERYLKLKLYATHNRRNMTDVISSLIDTLEQR